MAFVDRTFTTSIGRVRWPRFESSLFNFYANLLTITASGFTLERYRPFDGNTVRGTRYAMDCFLRSIIGRWNLIFG